MARSIKNHKVSYENLKKKEYSLLIASSFIKSEECSPFLRFMLDYENYSHYEKTHHHHQRWSIHVFPGTACVYSESLLFFPSTC